MKESHPWLSFFSFRIVQIRIKTVCMKCIDLHLGTVAWLIQLIRKISRKWCNVLLGVHLWKLHRQEVRSHAWPTLCHLSPINRMEEFLWFWWESIGPICRDIYHVTLGRMTYLCIEVLFRRFSIFNFFHLLENVWFLCSNIYHHSYFSRWNNPSLTYPIISIPNISIYLDFQKFRFLHMVHLWLIYWCIIWFTHFMFHFS